MIKAKNEQDYYRTTRFTNQQKQKQKTDINNLNK